MDVGLGLFVRRLCVSFNKLSFNQVVTLYQRFRVMYADLRDSRTTDVDVVAGSIVNETRDLSLDDLMDHSLATHSYKARLVVFLP